MILDLPIRPIDSATVCRHGVALHGAMPWDVCAECREDMADAKHEDEMAGRAEDRRLNPSDYDEDEPCSDD